MDLRYRLEAEWDGECWVVSFPKLPGCVGRGHDLLDAISAAEFAQDDYLLRWAEAERWAEEWPRR